VKNVLAPGDSIDFSDILLCWMETVLIDEDDPDPPRSGMQLPVSSPSSAIMSSHHVEGELHCASFLLSM